MNRILLLSLFALCAMFVNAQNQPVPKTITVVGEAEYQLVPDEIIIELTFQEYFTDKDESKAGKVTLETIEPNVLKAIDKVDIDMDKITSGGAKVVRPYKNGSYQKRRLAKSLYICVNNTKQYIQLTRSLENAGLFNEVVTSFNIQKYQSTEKEAYLEKSRSAAFEAAKRKATLILSTSNKKPGTVLNVSEMGTRNPYPRPSNDQYLRASNESSGSMSTPSGFQPITVRYAIQVTFEIE